MKDENKEEAEQEGDLWRQNCLSCNICGIKVRPEEAAWQEDDGGKICCKACRLERGSCGCSD